MNALYTVTVCIPLLLLILAGFNNAHGFTTFGKTPTNQQTQPPPPQVPAKLCVNHTDCYSIPQTSCVQEPRNPSRKSCLCGNNKTPENGACHTKLKGPNHMCTNDNECVDAANCVPMATGPAADNPNALKVCKCIEGFSPIDAECSSAGRMRNDIIFAVILLALSRTLF